MQNQKHKEYLDGLNKVIAQMGPADQAAARVVLAVGQILAEYITRRDWDSVKAIEDEVDDLFRQAWQVLAHERASKAQ